MESSTHTRSQPRVRRGRLDTFLYRHHALVHGVKTSLAAGIGLFIGWLLKHWIKDPDWHAEWIVISIVVVMIMIPNVGGVMLRAFYRLAATILAALIALAVILLSGNNQFAIIATLLIGVGAFTVLAQNSKYRQLGILSAVALSILLAIPDPKTSIILWRSLDITLGVIIVLLVSRCIFPIRASRQLRFHMADTIDRLGQLFSMASSREEIPEKDYEVIEDQITRGCIAQRESLPFALLEHHRVRSRKACLENMMRSQRVILGLSRTLRRAYSHTEFGEKTISSLDGLDESRARLTDQFHAIASCIRQANTPRADPELEISQATLKVSMKTATLGSDRPTMSPQAFTFAMEEIFRMTESLRKDAARVAVDLANAVGPDESSDMFES